MDDDRTVVGDHKVRIQHPERAKTAGNASLTDDDAIYQRNDVEEWFLRRGMPTVTWASSGSRTILLRASPMLFGFTLLYLFVSVLDVLLRELDPESYTTPGANWPAWYDTALLASPIVGIAAGILLNRYVRRGALRVWHVQALTTLIPLALLLVPVIDAMLGLDTVIWIEMAGNLMLMVLVLFLTRIGMGSIFAWSVRHAMTQLMALASMAARAIPMILLATLFAFLSDGVWAVTSSLARDQLWNVVLLFFGIAGIFIWVVIRDEMRNMVDGTNSSVDEVLAQRFPADSLQLENHAGEQAIRLTRRETANSTALLLIAQAIQISLLVMVVFTFFCVFGSVAIPSSVMDTWTGHSATTGNLLGLELPVNHDLIQTSLFLAAFSSVSFAASSVTDPAYRKSFFEPLLKDMTVTITARNLYHASRDAAPAPAPVTSQSIPAAPSDARR